MLLTQIVTGRWTDLTLPLFVLQKPVQTNNTIDEQDITRK